MKSLSAYATCMDVGNFEAQLKTMEELNRTLKKLEQKQKT